MRPAPSKLAAVLVATALVAACADAPTKQEIGTGVGAVAGGVIGSLFGHGLGKVAATAAGGLLGGWLGHTAGGALDRADKEKATEAAATAESAPLGEPVTWTNAETGHSGSTTATGDHVDAAGNRCRDYQSTVTVDGKDDVSHGTACRQSDGSWTAMK